LKEEKLKGREATMFSLVYKFLKEERGQGLTEYALIILLIAIACVAVAIIYGNQLLGLYNNLSGKVQP